MKRHEESADWQQFSFVPKRYQDVAREDILQIEHTLTPMQRAQFGIALKAIDSFIAEPRGNLILIGAVGSGRTMLAAYIAREATQSAIFITLSHLIALLTGPGEDDDPDRARDILYSVPVLIVDDFSAGFAGLEREQAQALYDLARSRWSEVLPIVVASDVPLTQLADADSAYRPIIDYLRQDAQELTFDWTPIQASRSASRATVHSGEPIPVEVHYCPFLGTQNGSEPPSIFPAPRNYCLRPGTPQPIALPHQAHTCLSAEHTECPVFQTPPGETLDELPPGLRRPGKEQTARRRRLSRSRLFSVLGVFGIISGLLLWVVILLNTQIIKLVADQPTRVPSPTYAPARTLTPTQTLTPTPTSTPLPTPTPAPPSATPVIAGEATLAFDSNLREGPGTDTQIVVYLLAGQPLIVLGRDRQGNWLRVETADGHSGWVATTQIEPGLDIQPLPIYQEQVSQPGASGTAEAAVPATFDILLVSTDISTCSYPDQSSIYTFNVLRDRISITRQNDKALLIGTFDIAANSFHVSSTRTNGQEDFDGTIQVGQGQVSVTGEQRMTYYDGSCSGKWSVSGQAFVEGH